MNMDTQIAQLLTVFGFAVEPDVNASNNQTTVRVMDAYWIIPDKALGIVREINMPFYGTFKNGYLAYLNSEGVHWEHYDDADRYVDVHGGVTFGEHHQDWSIIGFDTAHLGDEGGYSTEYIKERIDNMAHGLLNLYRMEE